MREFVYLGVADSLGFWIAFSRDGAGVYICICVSFRSAETVVHMYVLYRRHRRCRYVLSGLRAVGNLRIAVRGNLAGSRITMSSGRGAHRSL